MTASSKLHLPLVKRDAVTSSALPLPLGGGGGGNPPPPPPRPNLPNVSGCHQVTISESITVSDCKDRLTNAQLITCDYAVKRGLSIHIAQCNEFINTQFVNIEHNYYCKSSESTLISLCNRLINSAFVAVNQCNSIPISPSINYTICSKAEIQQAIQGINCHNTKVQEVSAITTCSKANTNSVNIVKCHQSEVQQAIPVPCRYYPIPIPPTIKPDHSACRLRPPSSRLPLPMTERQVKMPSSVLPLPMICWHDMPTATIPSLGTYIVHNVITATIGGIKVNVLSFDVKSDTDGYCCQGSVSITPRDYAKVKHLLDVPKHQKPLITVIINGEPFTIIAENRSESEKFAYTSHNISGRSVSARLSATFVAAQTDMLDQPNYASQIVNQQLNNTGISVDEWLINDWLIPANLYSAGGKTPIVVIDDIAKACGGFIDSHPYLPIITIKPRWKVPAWELATANPDVIIPASILHEIDKSERTKPRYNSVRIIGTEDAEVARRLQGKDMEAPSERGGLYSDRDCIVSKGIQILSESGDHGEHTFKIRWAKKYNIHLAKKGDIWQVNHPKGAYRCVVTGVAVSVKRDGKGVPKVWQFVTVDRYLDV